jgi:hypothetical protein
MVFSLRDTHPQPPDPEAAPHESTLSQVERISTFADDPGPLDWRIDDPLLRAADWAELFRRDFEYESFFDWFDKRNDDQRPDRLSLLNEIPLHFSPEQIPPPLRTHFKKVFGQ